MVDKKKKKKGIRIMKRTLALILAAGCAIGATAGTLNTPDQAKYNKALEYCASNPVATSNNVWTHAQKAVFADPPATIEALVARVSSVFDPVTFKTLDGKKECIEKTIAGFCLWSFDGKLAADGYNRAKAAGIDVTRFAIHAKAMGLPIKEEFALWVNLFCTLEKSDVWVWTWHQKRFVEILSAQPEADAKTALKRINRALSPKLLEDEAKWKPVVAGIRILLETY